MATTPMGVDTTEGGFESTDDAADAILNRWMDAGQLSKGGAEGTSDSEDEDEETKSPAAQEDEDNESDDGASDDDEGTQDDDTDQSEADDTGDDEDDGKGSKEASDDAVVKISVDGEERTVSVKDLKRLYGQEASLTRKSQEVAKTRKAIEAEGQRYTTAMNSLIAKAEERFKPYADIDWLVIQSRLEPHEFAVLREDARAAAQDLQFLRNEVDSTLSATQKEREAEYLKSAKECVEELERDIPNWSRKVYDDLRSYAVSQGMDEGDVNQIVSAPALKLIHKAMQYDAAQRSLKTKKKATAPTRVLKSKPQASQVLGKPSTDGALKRLKSTGSAEDAAALFLERWSAKRDD